MKLKPEERLVVAADFEPDPKEGIQSVRRKVLTLADAIAGTGVTIKVNSALRAIGYGLIEELHNRGLDVFADLKLNDIPATLATDGALLRIAKPRLVTAMCSTGEKALVRLREELPDTEVLGVTVFTTMEHSDVQAIYGRETVNEGVLAMADIASEAEIAGLINAPAELPVLTPHFANTLSFNTPNVRPEWCVVADDDQNPDRAMTPGEAIAAGSTRVVIGRPITQAPNPREAVERTVAEIAEAS